MASTSSSSASINESEKFKLKPENFPTYQSHLSSFRSSTSAPGYKHDVFLSFRGLDTRNTFTGHLHTALKSNGIAAFKDDEELDRGKQISPELLQAIEDSRLSMVVFSQNYATSSWCLDELVHILECMKPGKSIIPIFYDVDPSVIRHQSGTYATAFDEHQKNYPEDRVNKWRFGLSAVANISGWHLNHGSEPEFIQKIAEDVSLKLTTGTFEGLTDEINYQFQLDGTDSGFDGEINDQLLYDVFLSFNICEDTVLNFTKHLYTALHGGGIMTFMDNEESDKGKDISPELLQAIKGSGLFIVILSTNYAASSRCLDELVHILECKSTSETRKVLPIFYNVKSSVVLRQTNSYKKAFAKHEKNYKHHLEKVSKWRSALTEVGSLSRSWDLNNVSEEEFITDIVRHITHQLNKRVERKFEYRQKLVGDSRVKNLFSLLDTSVEDVRIIGIWGMGGVGKSTIAKSIYNKIYDQYEACCYLANVREISQRQGLVALQQQLLGSLLVEENIVIHNLHHGIEWIRQCFRDQKCLLVLDDVDQIEQLDALAGEADWFGIGSRIIIITRNEQLLNSKGVDKAYACTCEGLNQGAAIELLSKVAFKQKQPLDGYEMMCNRIIEYANGSPLVLKMVGSYLSYRSMEEWEYCLDKLKQTQDRSNIYDALHNTYNSLEDEQKNMFLDIACFFKGKKVDRVLEILDCCGFHSRIRMAILIDMSLVTISNNILHMHDLIQQMGWEIVRRNCNNEPGKYSRLWHQKDINEVMIRNLGTDKIQAMVLDQPELEWNWNYTAFKGLCNLRLLNIRSKVHLPEGLEYLPDSNLGFLKWRGYPLKYFPPNFYPSKLGELNMCHGQFELLWEGEKFFSNLKFIKLSHSENLIKTPNFTGVPNLERLVLEGCSNLVEVHPSIGILKKLRLLNLKDCSSLRSLPDFISMESLEICVLSGCSYLANFPNMAGNMINLSQLYLDGIRTENLPKSIFQTLWDHLPFNRRKWNNLACLVSIIPNVKKLSLRNCDLPEGAIPSDIGCLASLEVLDLGINKFVSLPTSISKLVKLKFLGLAHCNLLQSLPELPSNIEYVEARDCSSLVTFSNAFEVRTCTDLVLSFINCYKLKQNQDHKSIMITSLKAYLQSLLKIQNQELSHLSGCFDVVIPESRVPEWFRHQNMGPSVRIHLPPKWSNDNWIGFVFCVVFGVHQNVPDGEDGHLESENSQEMTCQLYTNEGPISTGFGFNISRGTFVESSHLWVCYISNGSFKERMAKWNRTRYIDASFEIDSHRLEVKKCGFRVVYKQDVEETSKRNIQYIFPPTEDLALGFFSFDT